MKLSRRTRIIELNGDIDVEQANRVTASLLLLASDDPTTEIALHIDSPGGLVSEAMAIHDTMALVEPPVSTCAVGMVAGVAQVLLTAGAPGRRYALPHARIHLLRATAGPATPRTTLNRVHWEMTVLTAEATGQLPAQVHADAARGREFTAEEAVAYGLVDKVVKRPRRGKVVDLGQPT